MQVDEKEHFLMSKEELENKIATFTGGRAAEELISIPITTGASNDIEQATKIPRGITAPVWDERGFNGCHQNVGADRVVWRRRNPSSP